jgi:hypothetical protein
MMVWLEVRVSRVHDAFFPTARFPEDGQEAAAALRGWFRSEVAASRAISLGLAGVGSKDAGPPQK